MLAKVRDALEQEQTERCRTAGLLEHEKQRTQLLLDVLKHFKEKLQSLTPQMLLSRLGGLDAKALLTGTADVADMGCPFVNGAPTLNGREDNPSREGGTLACSTLPACPQVPSGTIFNGMKTSAAVASGSGSSRQSDFSGTRSTQCSTQLLGTSGTPVSVPVLGSGYSHGWPSNTGTMIASAGPGSAVCRGPPLAEEPRPPWDIGRHDGFANSLDLGAHAGTYSAGSCGWAGGLEPLGPAVLRGS